ncbi:MAG: ATP-binding protein [Thermodesulfovibrionales bacterium]
MTLFPGSIKGRLFLWYSTFTALLLVFLGIIGFYEVRRLTFAAVDQSLHSKMQLATGLMHAEHEEGEEGNTGGLEVEIAELVTGEYAIPRSGHYYKVMVEGWETIYSPSLVDPKFNLETGSLEFHDKEQQEWTYISRGPNNEPLRVLRHDHRLLGKAITVIIAEDISLPLKRIESFKIALLFVVPLAILSTSLIGMWIINRSLQPLRRFCFKISRISSTNLSERMGSDMDVQELRVLATAFNRMLERLQKAFDAESRLISHASHELKTPISVIKGHCDVLLQQERSAEEYQEALNSINSVVTSMSRLINDMLSVARLDSGILTPADFKEVQVRNCIDDALKMIRPMAERRDISITSSIPEEIRVMGDRSLLTEAILNILSNAVKYNKDKGIVDISAWEKEGRIQISIRDTGMGISADEKDKIFERFYRSSAALLDEGTGLGLSISKGIIEAHRGEIRVESNPGAGSRFILSLPAPHRSA